jgi:predicted nuclease of predicted toxin-antitoxin system
MRLLVDENVPDGVTEVFRQRGHETTLVRDVFGQGTPDPIIAKMGDALRVIVVTFDRDLKSLASRAALGERQKFRNLGRISFRCRPRNGVTRLLAVVESIEFEFEQVQQRNDKRLIVEITDTTFVVVR